jgi:hypothetical protein
MNRRLIIIFYVFIIVLMLVVFCFVQRRYSYEKTHPPVTPIQTSISVIGGLTWYTLESVRFGVSYVGYHVV